MAPVVATAGSLSIATMTSPLDFLNQTSVALTKRSFPGTGNVACTLPSNGIHKTSFHGKCIYNRPRITWTGDADQGNCRELRKVLRQHINLDNAPHEDWQCWGEDRDGVHHWTAEVSLMTAVRRNVFEKAAKDHFKTPVRCVGNWQYAC